MKLIFTTRCGDRDSCGCDYAILDLDKDTARRILKRLELVCRWEKDERDLTRTEFHVGMNPEYFSYFEELDTFETLVNPDGSKNENIMHAPDDWQIPEGNGERTECDRIVIYANGRKDIDPTIFFICYPKHADVEIETEYLPLWCILKAAEREDWTYGD